MNPSVPMLPLVPDPAARGDRRPGDASERVNILVVDDQPDKLLAFESVLETLNENVVSVRSGREALKRMLEREFAVILLDVKMPEMDGFETAALIRGRKKTAHTPIIFVTAYQDEMHAAEGYSLGAVDYILTPIVPEVLRSKVRVFVQLYRMRKQIEQQAEERIALMREQAARAIAEESIRRSRFLAEASQVLSRSLDVAETIRDLTRFVVPSLARLCGLMLVEESGEIRKTQLAWVEDTTGAPANQEDFVFRLADPTVTPVVVRALAEGSPQALDLGTEQRSLMVDRGEPEPDVLPIGFGLRHVQVFPLLARGRKLGALLLGTSGPEPPGLSGVALAADLAGRTAIALDNGLLYSKVQEADQRKDEFLAMLAHELRNPLAPIRTAVSVLRRTVVPDRMSRESQDIIDRQVEQLTRLVDDLLDVSRLTQGKIRLERTRVELGSIMERAVETARPDVMRRRHVLTIEPPRGPVYVDGDPVRLAQVFSNLLNNAAKYTAEGGKILFAGEQVGEHVVVRVADNGSGIAADVLPHVFDLFTQANRSLARSEGGLGIGLTIVRTLLEKHGGSVEARSAGIGKGSEFTVRLPVTFAPPLESRRADPEPATAAGGCRILLVDDNVDSNAALNMLLSLDGHDVRQAPDGAEALRIAHEFKPELVLCDIGLPDMDGYEVVRHLREQSGDAMPPVAALTGYARPVDRERIRQAGFVCHLVKPVEPELLEALIAAHARKSHPERSGDPSER